MASILNIKGTNNTEIKSLSTKLSFKIGEIFSAKVENIDPQSSVVLLKMLDGWQFAAKLQVPLQVIPEGMLMFKVEGMQDGKLEIKIVNNGDEAETPVEIDGFNSEDNILLKNMLKHNMPLSRENVSEIKTLINFRNRLSQDSEAENSFIGKYIQSKGIQLESESGKNIEEKLKDFFSEFKNVSDEEMLVFKENGIEFNSENIRSFNRLFKEDQVLFREVTGGAEQLSVLQDKDNDIKTISSQGESVSPKEIEEFITEYTKSSQDSKTESDIINRYLGDKGIDPEGDSGKKIIGELKNIITSFKNITDEPHQSNVQNIWSDESKLVTISYEGEKVTPKELQSVNTEYIKILQNPKVESDIINRYLGNKGIDPESIIGKEVIRELKNFIASYKNGNEEKAAVYKEKVMDDYSPKSTNLRISLKTGEKFFAQMESVDEQDSTVILKMQNEERVSVKLETPLKNVSGKLQQFRVEDVQNDMPEVIVIDSETEGNADFTSHNIKDFNKFINDNQELFKKVNGGITKKISLLGKENNSELSQEVKEQISDKAALMKEVIKEVMLKGSSLLNNGLNDFKVLNTVSNQYYYMDIPLDIDNGQYGCKLIIKDDRSKGKKLDSKNIKLSVSISTMNLGVVDSYIKVKDNILNINMKCNEQWVKIFDKNKEQLLSILRDFNYNPSLKVEKIVNCANIVNTRDFFEDNDLVSINVRV